MRRPKNKRKEDKAQHDGSACADADATPPRGVVAAEYLRTETKEENPPPLGQRSRKKLRTRTRPPRVHERTS